MSTGIIPSKVDTCTLNIYVSEVDCSPSSKLANQLSAEHTTFDKAKFADGGYTLLYVKYTSPDSISGFQFEINMPLHHTKIAAVGTKLGSESSQTSDKKFVVFNSKNTVIGVFDPEISGSAVSTSYNLTSQSTDTALCYILLEKGRSFTNNRLCPDEVTIRNVKACRNLDDSDESVISVPKDNWKGHVSRNTGLSDIYLASRLLATNTYNPDLDADNDGTIDIIDVAALANKKHNMLWDKSNTNVVPDYICKDHKDFVTKSDLNAELSIISAKVVSNEKDASLYDLSITLGLRSSNSTSGFQVDIGQDIFGISDGKEKVEFLGPLKGLGDNWAYKFESIRNRFNRDKVTRIIAYQLPVDVNNVQVKSDLESAEQILSVNSLEPLQVLTPVIKYSLRGADLSGGVLPEPRYFYADELGSNVQDKKEIKNAKRKGERYYGPINLVKGEYYTGERHNPRTSRRLTAKWDIFELLNERIVTNDFLNYFEHGNHGLKYAGFDLAYNISTGLLSDHFDNDLGAYFKYLVNYLYVPVRKGLDSQLSNYNYEPSGAADSRHDGYISDANLDGTHDVGDTIALVNIATQKLSATESTTLKVLQELSQNESRLSLSDKADSSNQTDICDDEDEIRYNLKSLTKIVPTYVLNNFTTTTFPHNLPSITSQNTDATTIFFTQRVDVSGGNYPPEFKNWSEYFNDLHSIKYYETPEASQYSFVKVNMATNTPKVNFIKTAEFMLDFSNTFTSMSGKKLWIYPGEGFPTSSYALTVRSGSATGSQIAMSVTGSNLVNKVHVKLDISGSTSLTTPITYDGGTLNLVKVFFSTLPDYISGKYVDFVTSPSTGSIESVGKPYDRAGSANYIQHTTSDRLVFGPKSSYLSQQYEDNSSSPQIFGDVLLHLRAVGPSSIDVEYTAVKPFNTASFEIRSLEGIEISSIDTTLYLPAQANYTASLASSYEDDGKTTVNLYAPPGTLVSGSGELLRLKTSRQLFPYELLQSGKELLSPPKGASGDLVIPNVVKTSVFPSISNLELHIDPSGSNWVKTTTSASATVTKIVANPYGIPNLSQSHSSSMPLYTNAASSMTTGINYLHFNNSGSMQVISSSMSDSELDSVNLNSFTYIGVFEPDTLEGEWEKTVFEAESSENTFTVGLKGKTSIPSEGSVYVTTSGAVDGQWTFDMNFSSTDYTGDDVHVMVITSDGSDSTTNGTKVRFNGTLVTSSYSYMGSNGAAATSYMFGGTGSSNINYFVGKIGETMLFSGVLSDDEITIFEGYTAHKWGTTSKLPAAHKYKSIKPNTSNTTTNNTATSAAIKKSQNYFAGSGSASDRAGSWAVSKYIGITDVTIASGSSTYTNPNYTELRELPREINQTSSATGGAEIFVNHYDSRNGILELGYKSERKVDGYWVQLGNSFSGSGGLTAKQVGIIAPDKKDRISEVAKKRWSQYIGYGPNEYAIYNKDPRRVKSIKQIAFGFAQGRIGKTNSKESKRDFYRASGSWYVPPTPSGETNVLTRLKIDPRSFKGTPTISSWRLVTNDRITTPTGSWTGDTSGGTVGYDDLSTVIKYAQFGFVNTGSVNSTLASEAVKFDSEGDGNNLDIVDVLSVFNHLVGAQGPASTDTSLKIVPQNTAETLVTAPGAPTVTATAGPCVSGSIVTLAWTTGSGGTPSGFEIWRKGTNTSSNKKKRSNLFLFTGNREKLFDKTTNPFKRIKTINSSTSILYVDKDPPYNEKCCSDNDNPKIEYTVVAFNEGGENTGTSNTVQLSCCNNVPTARNLSLTSSVNTAITFTMDVTENNAAPPFGTASADTDDVEVLTFNIADYGNGKLDQLKNNDGIFTFYPQRDYLGKTTIFYEVSNEAGCRGKAQVDIEFTPAKFPVTCKVLKPMARNDVALPVLVQWSREDVRGKILKYQIFRAISGSSYDATATSTIDGKLPISEKFVKHYDKVVPATSSVSYKYKVKAYGFQGKAVNTITEGRYSTIETEDCYVTIPARVTGSNPVVTVSSSAHTDSYHPLVKLTWPSASAGSRDVQYYNVYRTLRGKPQYLKQASIKYTGGSVYTFFDKKLPDPDKLSKYGVTDYISSYRLTSVSDHGENGDPNSGWTGSTYTASISGVSNIPIAQNRTYSVCASDPLTASVSSLVYNKIDSATTYSASVLSGLTFATSTGVFSYSNASTGVYTFIYSATSGTKTSNNGTITLQILDCTDLACPPGEKAKHVICDSYDVQGEQTKTVDQVPFGLREAGGQNIRSSSKPYVISKGEIDTSED